MNNASERNVKIIGLMSLVFLLSSILGMAISWMYQGAVAPVFLTPLFAGILGVAMYTTIAAQNRRVNELEAIIRSQLDI